MIFTELRSESTGQPFDLPDYHKLFTEVGLNQHYAAVAAASGASYTPTGRKALTAQENSQFLYSALYAGAKRSGLPLDFDVDTVSDWIDEAEQSDDPEAIKEITKPFATHYNLLTQRLERQAARPGNALAPTLKAVRGGTTKAKPKAKTKER